MANSAQESSNLYSELPLWASTPVDIEVKEKTPFGNAAIPFPPGTRQEAMANRSRPPLHSNPEENNGRAGMKVDISVSVKKQKL